MTPQERTVLEALLDARGAIVSYDDLRSAVGNEESPTLVKALIHRIRRDRPDLTIKTIHGEGYCLTQALAPVRTRRGRIIRSFTVRVGGQP